MYDLLTGKIETLLTGHKGNVRDVSWHPYRQEIVTASVSILSLEALLLLRIWIKSVKGMSGSALHVSIKFLITELLLLVLSWLASSHNLMRSKWDTLGMVKVCKSCLVMFFVYSPDAFQKWFYPFLIMPVKWEWVSVITWLQSPVVADEYD